MALWFLLNMLRLYVVERWSRWQAWKDKRRRRDEKPRVMPRVIGLCEGPPGCEFCTDSNPRQRGA